MLMFELHNYLTNEEWLSQDSNFSASSWGCSGSYKTIVRQCPASDKKLLEVFKSTATMAASPNSF